ncbi:MAG: ABC transporter ATP-binding protein [Chloroflexi bacterium]|nr:ABC transporter ATP-binding protein [Chloroflexota bacterium]
MATTTRNVLEVRDLRTYFYTQDGVVKAVDGVSFDLKEGETLGLVGESGCGKSVTALSIMRLIPNPPGRTVGGQVLLEGSDLLKLRDREMRQIRGGRIAMVFQEPMSSLNPVLTIGRQITEALETHLKLTRREARDRAGELLARVGLADPKKALDSYPHLFSGGMRQRVMLAMALGCNPSILLADEPTTALDVTIQAQILEMLKRLTTELGTAVILITHNLGVVARYADRVNIMYAGKIVETGYARDIYGNPRHPYTLGLLATVPRLDQPKRARLTPIDGMPPDLAHLAPGCSFRPRCPYAVARCAQEEPPLTPVGESHASACWVAHTLTERSPTAQRQGDSP